METAANMDLMAQYSLCTTDGTEEEEELTNALTAELAADFGLLMREQSGDASMSRHSSLQTASSMLSALEEPQEEPEASLYDQLGGGVAVKGVVDDFYRRVLSEPAMARFFDGVDMAKHRRKFLLFVTYALGGPDEYLQLAPEPWPQLYSAHERLILQYGERPARVCLLPPLCRLRRLLRVPLPHLAVAARMASAPDALVPLCFAVRAGLNETHFDAIKVLFATTLRDAGAPEHLIEQALAVVESTRRVLFPLDPAAQKAKEAKQAPAKCPHMRQLEEEAAAAAAAAGAAAGAAAAAGGCPHMRGSTGAAPSAAAAAAAGCPHMRQKLGL